MRMNAHLPAWIFHCMPLRKIITPLNFLCFWIFRKRPNMSPYVEYSPTLIWFFEDFKFAYKTTKFLRKITCAQLRTKTRTSISRKICLVRSRFQILYAAEQFSLLFSKGKLLKSKGHTYTSPWSAFPAHIVVELPYSSQPIAPTCVVWRWHLEDSPVGSKGSFIHGFSLFITRRLCHADGPNKQLSMTATARVIWLCACLG